MMPLRPPIRQELPVQQLTPRQRQVMECCVNDMDNGSIGSMLGIEPQSVAQAKYEAKKRLRCRTIEAAVVRFDRIRGGR
jgi:FixJ family two-component response regulator